MASVRTATAADLAFLAEHDNHIRAASLDDAVQHRRMLISDPESSSPLGWLRWSLFWDEIPFMNMLFVLEKHRRTGCGSQLVAAWERQAHAAGHKMVMTSTLADEAAQHFYRRLGYVDTGCLLLPGEATEIIFRKQLSN